MIGDRNIAQEAREQTERAQMVRAWERPSNPPKVGPAFPRSRSISVAQEWPLDVIGERELSTSAEFDRADARVLAGQVLAASVLDETDRRILRAIIAGDSSVTLEEIAAEADISRTTLWRRLRMLRVVLADSLAP